jgi:hypothetical protein
MSGPCGRFQCRGCFGCDPDGSFLGGNETERQRAQRRKREEDLRRAAGAPTMQVKLGDAVARQKESDR